MKTHIMRVLALSAAITSLIVCAACEEKQAQAETIVPPEKSAADSTRAVQAATVKAAPTKEQAKPNSPVEPMPVMPEHLKVSPGLAEIAQLAQAGVSEEVMLTYVNHSTNIYYIGSDEILYLNDLGVSTSVITALIQRDASPEIAARKQAAAAVQPLPPGVALNTPAPNVYPSSFATTPPAALPPAVSETVPAPPAPVAVTQSVEPHAQQPVTVSYFYNYLAPYGNWVEVDGYGRCWQPTVAVVNSSWRPYGDRGRWLWSDAGWYWYSDYSWGWAPFHYGRWHSAPRLGWVWVPGTSWGPSWVSWRYSGSYCGWAPLPPEAHFVSGAGFYYHNGPVTIGFDFGLSPSCYTFIPLGRFCDRTPYRHYVAPAHATTIYKDSVVVNNYITGNNNTIVNKGIGVDAVSKVTGAGVPKVTIRENFLMAHRGARAENLDAASSSIVLSRPKISAELPIQRFSPTLHSGSLPIKNGSAPGTGKSEPNPRGSAPMPGSAPKNLSYQGNNMASTIPTPTTATAPEKVLPIKPDAARISKPYVFTPHSFSAGSLNRPSPAQPNAIRTPATPPSTPIQPGQPAAKIIRPEYAGGTITAPVSRSYPTKLPAAAVPQSKPFNPQYNVPAAAPTFTTRNPYRAYPEPVRPTSSPIEKAAPGLRHSAPAPTKPIAAPPSRTHSTPPAPVSIQQTAPSRAPAPSYAPRSFPAISKPVVSAPAAAAKSAPSEQRK